MVAEDKLEKRQQVDVARRDESDRYYRPATDIRETNGEVVLTFDMPGVGKDNVEVTVDKGTLTVIGRVDKEELGEAVYRETRVGDYKRQFTLGEDVDSDKIAGEMKDGVLTVRIAKSEAAKPRKIEILSG